MKSKFISLSVAWLASYAHAETPCSFDSVANAYQGTAVQQATCLLRPVKRFATLGEESPLPATLAAKLASGTIDVTRDQLRTYLAGKNIAEGDIGGALEKSLNTKTRYFIVHDTSSPNYKAAEIPNVINTVAWSGNKLSQYSAKAHVYINRIGASATKIDLSENQRATKFELKDNARRNLFVSIELIQPRRSFPEGSSKNDAQAPIPGFSPEQYQRLALVYLAASIRAGRYLIPAFHAVIDAGLPNGHDDPQNFDLNTWDKSLAELLVAVSQAG